jgi:DNA-binding LacI/PurR family transcriptional regulator
MSKVTMKDVAQAASVSLATVSRSIRNPELVNAETLHQVEAAISKTHYKYNHARAHSGTLPVIGITLPNTICFGFADTLMGIQDACLARGYALTVGCTNYESPVERKILVDFRKNSIAGLILAGFSLSNETLIREFVNSGIPVCVIWEKSSDNKLSYVGFDNFQAVYDLASYLISLGHRSIGMICGPFSKSDRPYRRLNGYRTALEEHLIRYEPSLVYEGIPSMAEGKKGMKQIMSHPQPPTAVLAAADVFALGALSAAHEMDLRIPEDLSLVGMDDIPYTAFSIPPLTTAHIPAYDMGYKAVEVITKNISEGQPKVVHYNYEVEIVHRASTRKISIRQGKGGKR